MKRHTRSDWLLTGFILLLIISLVSMAVFYKTNSDFAFYAMVISLSLVGLSIISWFVWVIVSIFLD